MTCRLCSAPLDGAYVVGEMGRTGPLRTVCCVSCGLVQSDPAPSQDELDAYYASGEYRRQFPPLPRRRRDGTWCQPDDDDYEQTLDHGAEDYAPDLAENIGLSAGATVAEVGCGDGRVNAALRRLGFDAVAVEQDSRMAEKARANGAIVVDALPYSVDAVFALQVLEHFADPVERLSSWVQRVRDGGSVYVEVPNVDRPYGGLAHFFQYPHVVNFSHATLAVALLMAGCESVQTAEAASVLCARGVVGSLPKRRSYVEACAMLRIEMPPAESVVASLQRYEWRAMKSPTARMTRFLAGAPLAELGDDAEDLMRREFQRSADMAGSALSMIQSVAHRLDETVGEDPNLWNADPFWRGYLCGRAAGFQRAQLAVSHVANALTRKAVEGD